MSTTATVTATNSVPTATKTSSFVFSCASVYSASKDLYASYCPVVAATVIATVLTKALMLNPVDGPKTLESLDSFLASLCNGVDANVDEVKSTGVKVYVSTRYIEIYAFLTGKVANVKTAMHTKLDCTRVNATSKYDEVKTVVAKKVEQTMTVAKKAKIVAEGSMTAVKSEIEKDGLVVVATKASDIAREQAAAAIEVFKAEGISTLFKNVTDAVVEVLDEATVVTEPAPAPTPAPALAPASAPAPALTKGPEAPAAKSVTVPAVPTVAPVVEVAE